MNEFEEQTVNALTILFEKVITLRHNNIQAAYDALTTVEDALTSLGMKLEYEHWRLGGAVEELTPLMIHTRSSSDIIMEAFEQ